MNAGTSNKRSGTGRSLQSSRQRRKKPWPKACWTRLPKRMRKPLRSEEKSQRKLDRAAAYEEAKMRAVRVLGKVWFAETGTIVGACDRCGSTSTLDVHHVRGRAGMLLCDQRYWKLVCRTCHKHIHSHIEESRKRGWIAKPGEWGKTVEGNR